MRTVLPDDKIETYASRRISLSSSFESNKPQLSLSGVSSVPKRKQSSHPDSGGNLFLPLNAGKSGENDGKTLALMSS